MFRTLKIENYPLSEGKVQSFEMNFQIFGRPLHQAPIILVNHALTGNSNVAGENGWWKDLIGKGKGIDLDKYTIIAINIPGNGFQNSALVENYQDLNTKIIAELYWKTLEALKITHLFAIIGGSLGGSIAWEMAFQKPNSIENLIPIACSIKSSDWLIGNVKVQEQILLNSTQPIEDARMHAMLLYRTPASLQEKFQNKRKENQYLIENWLEYHGKTLNDRFNHSSYLLMNHLLRTIGAELNQEKIIEFSKNTSSSILSIAIDTDYMFTRDEQYKVYQTIKKHNEDTDYQEIKSIHGHDAFLIEYQQLTQLINPIF